MSAEEGRETEKETDGKIDRPKSRDRKVSSERTLSQRDRRREIGETGRNRH